MFLINCTKYRTASATAKRNFLLIVCRSVKLITSFVLLRVNCTLCCCADVACQVLGTEWIHTCNEVIRSHYDTLHFHTVIKVNASRIYLTSPFPTIPTLLIRHVYSSTGNRYKHRSYIHDIINFSVMGKSQIYLN